MGKWIQPSLVGDTPGWLYLAVNSYMHKNVRSHIHVLRYSSLLPESNTCIIWELALPIILKLNSAVLWLNGCFHLYFTMAHYESCPQLCARMCGREITFCQSVTMLTGSHLRMGKFVVQSGIQDDARWSCDCLALWVFDWLKSDWSPDDYLDHRLCWTTTLLVLNNRTKNLVGNEGHTIWGGGWKKR